MPLKWDDPITENPALFATEVWEIHNFTVDAHPIHIHEVMFQVVNREPMANPPPLIPDGDDPPIVQVRATVAQAPSPPEAWERGWKDTVIAYPGQITRVRMRFDLPGFYVWHCHIVEHEDNEMMRPLHVGPIPADSPIQAMPPMP